MATKRESGSRITRRDYFAARAPEQPQPWFEPTMRRPHPVRPAEELGLDGAGNLSRNERDNLTIIANALRGDPTFDLSTYTHPDPALNALVDALRPVLTAYHEAWVAWRTADAAYGDELAKQALVQWPYAWADAVLAQR